MPRSRVFILYRHGLFARGVQSLLAREEEVDVVGMEKDDPQVIGRLKELSPDVILVDSGARPEDSCLTLSEIFRELPEARVIRLDLQENGVDIYDRQRIAGCGPEELVHAIRQKAG